MKKGDVVTIYESPLTERKPEGEAKLLHKIHFTRASGLEYWKVQFVSDGFECSRWIKSKE